MTIGGGTLLSDRFGNAIARRPIHGRRVCFARGSRAAPQPPLWAGCCRSRRPGFDLSKDGTLILRADAGRTITARW